jgi:hypothetical protein
MVRQSIFKCNDLRSVRRRSLQSDLRNSVQLFGDALTRETREALCNRWKHQPFRSRKALCYTTDDDVTRRACWRGSYTDSEADSHT